MPLQKLSVAVGKCLRAVSRSSGGYLSIDGAPKCFDDSDMVSGRTVRRYFCGDCGSPAYVVVERALTTAYVFTGLLNQTSDMRPKVHGWTTTKNAWAKITEGGLQYDMDPGLSPR